jgi:hypothetical protein
MLLFRGFMLSECSFFFVCRKLYCFSQQSGKLENLMKVYRIHQIKIFTWLFCTAVIEILSNALLLTWIFSGPWRGCDWHCAPPSQELGCHLCRRLYDEDMEGLSMFIHLFWSCSFFYLSRSDHVAFRDHIIQPCSKCYLRGCIWFV